MKPNIIVNQDERPSIGYVGLADARSAELVPVFNQVMALATFVTAIAVTDLEALLAEYDRTDTLGPILDPTTYRRHMRNIPQHREVAEKVLELRRAIQRVIEREAQEKR